MKVYKTIPAKSQLYHCIFFVIDLIDLDLNKIRKTPMTGQLKGELG